MRNCDIAYFRLSDCFECLQGISEANTLINSIEKFLAGYLTYSASISFKFDDHF